MREEPEIKAMGIVYDAMKELSDDSKLRIVNWLTAKFALTKPLTTHKKQPEELNDGSYKGTDINSIDSIEDLFSHIDPKGISEKVLVVSSFLQVKDQKTDLTGREINQDLRNLGHGVKNITNAIQSLIDRTPKLMIQTRKAGTTKQAQKKYKVTTEGLKVVREMLQTKEETQK